MVRSFATYVTKMEESNFSCNDSIGYVPMNVLGWWVVLGQEPVLWAIRAHKVEAMDESSTKAKLDTGRTHEEVMDFAQENFDASIKKYRAMIQKDQSCA